MNKTPNHLRNFNAGNRNPVDTWHAGGDIDIRQYARALQNAAKMLIANVKRNEQVRADWDVCPIILLYRQSLEIHLKLLVGEGSNFLPSPIDPISLSTTHSLRWLAQIVCRIIKAVDWQKEFTCEGVRSIADFTAVVNEVESFDPVSRAIRNPKTVSEYYRDFDIVGLAKRLDALLDLLDSTADAMAAESDREELANFGNSDDIDFNPTIQ